MQDLTVTIIQTDLIWENGPANIAKFDSLIKKVPDNSDLVILPEMFTTGFSMNADKLAETADGGTVRWMKEKSKKGNMDLVGSLIIKENSKYYNRLFLVKPDGMIFTYDKRHLFRMATEHNVYSQGNDNITIELKGWRIRPLICYDLRFPAWVRNRDNDYDLLIFIANWPERRARHWKTLLQARAIENQVYTIGVNRVGRDGKNIIYSGDSMIIDPIGNVLFHEENNEIVQTEILSFSTLTNYREKFPVWKDADNFGLKL